MATATPDMPEARMREHRHAAPKRTRDTSHDGAKDAPKRFAPLLAFWTKINNDWVFDFSGELAYNFLTSLFPILLAIIGIAGFVVGTISPESKTQLINGIAHALPGGAGGSIVTATTENLRTNAGVLLIIGLVTAFFTGSRLFITLEKHFGIIFRLRGRDPLHQNLMALGMMLLYLVLVPVVLLGAVVPPAIAASLIAGGSSPITGFFVQAVGLAAALVSAIVLFGAIYIVVPNRPVHLKEVWKGTLAAAGLLVVYELIFPFYQSTFLKPSHYGAIAGFAVVILIFFYYLGFILLLGAEVNSWAHGQRQTAAPLDGILHELQAHNTTRGAAGPTAGQPSEDLQSSKGADAMRDTATAISHERQEHQYDMKPPTFAESGTTGAGYHARASDASDPASLATTGATETAPGDGGSSQPAGATALAPRATPQSWSAALRTTPRTAPLTLRQRRALGLTVAASAIALAPVVRAIGHFMFGDDDTGTDLRHTPTSI